MTTEEVTDYLANECGEDPVFARYDEDIENIFYLEDGEGNTFKVTVEKENSRNRRGVPYHRYHLYFTDGTDRTVEIGDVDDWCNIQPCVPGDCKDWKDAIGWGSDAEGHTKIARVEDVEECGIWAGNGSVRTWYEECVAKYADNYSD